MMGMEHLDYVYKPISVPGGGFVTGFVFHPTVSDLLYCRTDIGGTYRYDFNSDQWVSLIDHATDPGVWETYPLSIALDKQNPNYLYVLTGLIPTHKIAFSDHYGENFVYYDTPFIPEKGNTATVHGNAPGRSTGERLVVDPNDSDILYLGTMEDGLWKTVDRCKSWSKLSVHYPGCEDEKNIAFIEIDETSGDSDHASTRIVVATNGEAGSLRERVRGQSVYISCDGGATFRPLDGEPEPVLGGESDYPGYVGQHAVFVGQYLFVSYAAYNIGWSSWNTYGCDTGKCYDGALFRFSLDDEGNVTEGMEVTPPRLLQPDLSKEENPKRRLGYGISGISGDRQKKGTLLCTTITASPDTIYRSTDYGVTWKPILSGLQIGRIDFNVSYQKPEYNGNDSLIHWMADIKINPFNRDIALFNTGAGVFMTKDLTKADQGEEVTFACCNRGLEETVHLNLYSPPSGAVKVIDIIGDYGGIAFKELDKPVGNTFQNRTKDRWITAMNADYPEGNPQLLVVAPRGNWTGRTKGGLILSEDQGDNWEQLGDPWGITKDMDELLQNMKKPNVTAGWTAITADGRTILWQLGYEPLANRTVYTRDRGETWNQSILFDKHGLEISGQPIPFKVMSDRVNPNILYGFGITNQQTGFFVSVDQGGSFHECTAPMGFPELDLSGIDSQQHYEIRVEPGNEGVIWLALQQHGLWKLQFSLDSRSFAGNRITDPGDFIKRIGLGKPVEGSTCKTLFTSGTIQCEYGFYRSVDGGITWSRINDDRHQYGDIRSISGDPRVFGRIYVATGTRGLVYGEPRGV